MTYTKFFIIMFLLKSELVVAQFVACQKFAPKFRPFGSRQSRSDNEISSFQHANQVVTDGARPRVAKLTLNLALAFSLLVSRS
jgi:hypothetical protein